MATQTVDTAMFDIKKLREEFSTLKSEIDATFDKKVAEKREYTADEKSAQETKFARCESIKNLLDEQMKFASLAIANGEGILPKEPDGKEDFQFARNADIQVKDKIDRVEFNKAGNQWLLTGNMDRKFATITTASNGSILLPTSVAQPQINPVMNVYRQALAVYGVTPVSTPTAEKINYPIIGSANGGAVAQNASSETENEPNFAGIVLEPTTYQSGSAWVSKLQLASNAFDLMGFIETELEQAKELGLEKAITDALVADAGITQELNISSGLSYDDLVGFNNALPRRYNRQKVMVVDKATYVAMEGLVDDNNRPILVLDPQNGGLVRFNGTPVFWVDEMAQGSSEGDILGVIFSLLGFKLRDVTGNREVERYIEKGKPGQIGSNLISYHAFGWADAAVAKLKV